MDDSVKLVIKKLVDARIEAEFMKRDILVRNIATSVSVLNDHIKEGTLKFRTGPGPAPAPGPKQKMSASAMKAPKGSAIRYHPMKTSCYAPSNPPVLDQRLPESGIALDYIHGYTSDSAKSAGALNWLHSGEVIFPAAAVVVLMNHKTNRQRFFCGHTHDVSTLAIHPTLDIVASGQTGVDPSLCLWDAHHDRPRLDSRIHLTPNSVGVSVLDFSPDGEILLCLAQDQAHTLSLWNWHTGVMMLSCRTNNNVIRSMRWNSTCYTANLQGQANYALLSVGTRHIKFWSLSASSAGAYNREQSWNLDGNQGSYGDSAEKQNITCMCFVHDQDGDLDVGIPPSGRIVTGTDTGHILVWIQLEGAVGSALPSPEYQETVTPRKPRVCWKPQGKLVAAFRDVHGGAVHALAANGRNSKNVVSCGQDGSIKVWRSTIVKHLQLISSVSLSAFGPLLGEPVNISADPKGARYIIGTSTNSVCLFTAMSATGASGSELSYAAYPILQSFNSAKRVGVACHPGRALCITADVGKELRVWDLAKRHLVCSQRLSYPGVSCAFDETGANIAVGCAGGEIVLCSLHPQTYLLKRREVLKPSSAKAIAAIRFSPDGATLAAASHDGSVHIWRRHASGSGFKRTGVCRGHTSAVMHVDFSADGNSIQSDSLSRECLYFDVHTAKPLNAYGMRDTVFASWSCLYGWPTQGMWDEEHQVNAVSRSSDGTVVAYQDTAELLCFSRWPSLSGTCPREYPFVPSAKAVVEFTSDSRSLLHLSEVMTQYKVGSQ